MGLLAMQHFAPRSIVVLGWCFLLAGTGTLVFTSMFPGVLDVNDVQAASWLMAFTFGLFHVVYAMTVWAMGEGSG